MQTTGVALFAVLRAKAQREFWGGRGERQISWVSVHKIEARDQRAGSPLSAALASTRQRARVTRPTSGIFIIKKFFRRDYLLDVANGT